MEIRKFRDVRALVTADEVPELVLERWPEVVLLDYLCIGVDFILVDTLFDHDLVITLTGDICSVHDRSNPCNKHENNHNFI